MIRSEFEDILITETPYYQDLTHTYRDPVSFSRNLGILKRIAHGDSFLASLEKNSGRELVFLGRKIFSLQEEFVTIYLNFLNDEAQINKWEEFFERYSKSLFNIYDKFIKNNPDRVLIFEIVNRKLLRDLMTKHTSDRPFEEKPLIAERFGVVVNQLFNYIRNSLSRQARIADKLILESYEKIPLLPRCSRNQTMRMLNRYFIQKGLPESIYNVIYKLVVSNYYLDEKEKILKDISKREFLTKDGIIEILNTHFFLPDESTLEEVLQGIKKKFQDSLTQTRGRREQVERKAEEINKKIRDLVVGANQELITITADFSTEEALDNNIKKLRRNLLTLGYDLRNLRREQQDTAKMEAELDSIMKIKTTDLSKFIMKNDWDSILIVLLNPTRPPDEEPLQLLLKDAFNELKNDKAAMASVNDLRTPGFLKEKYNTQEILRRFKVINDEIILPLVKALLLEELIEYYPKLSGSTSSENIRYVAEEALQGNVSVVEKDIRIPVPSDPPKALNILRFKNLTTVLVYDIRGSTFMGTKLQDAKRENEIRNLFQESMLAVIEKYGGIPVKDTGDGGIALFAENRYEIKKHQTHEIIGGSVLDAVRAGLGMAQEANNFVEENIGKYRDWFYRAEERNINFEGASYATLPPSYQAIFQIGVGIASGEYPREIFLDHNPFGDLDLTGMLIREANFYSRVKAKGKSTIICDDATVYNLLLNTQKFSFLSESGLNIDPVLLDVEQGLEYWINQKVSRHGFIFDLYKIFVTELGQEIYHPGSMKILVGMKDAVTIDETGEIKDGKGGRGKFLFEITPEMGK
jgi:class 3 adenylate cyclase